MALLILLPEGTIIGVGSRRFEQCAFLRRIELSMRSLVCYHALVCGKADEPHLHRRTDDEEGRREAKEYERRSFRRLGGQHDLLRTYASDGCQSAHDLHPADSDGDGGLPGHDRLHGHGPELRSNGNHRSLEVRACGGLSDRIEEYEGGKASCRRVHVRAQREHE